VIDDSADVARNPLAGIAVAIDGVYASGKGTLASTLARLYRMKFLDTGALYRAVAWKLLEAGQDTNDPDLAEKAARTLAFDFRHKGNNIFGVWVDGRDVTDAIRMPAVAENSSVVAVQPKVRAALFDFQVEFARHWQPKIGVVMDGRDIGGRIMPQAQVKLFLTGDVEVRARRRWLEYAARGKEKPLEAVIAELRARDGRDTDNTIRTPDALTIDTTAYDQAGVLKAAEEAIAERIGAVARAPAGE
jgi:cytidylate kinase